jgi:hypothetical protein
MNTTIFSRPHANERRGRLPDDFATRLRMCRGEFDDDDCPVNRRFNSHDWDEFDDDDEFDPEPTDDELDDDFDLDQIPDETQCPPEELWNDADWE